MYAKNILLVFLCLFSSISLTAKIRNGYATDVAAARECIHLLNQRLSVYPAIKENERRHILAAMKLHAEAIQRYELTESLLVQFKMMSRDMYRQIDELRDKRGRETDVYVRFIPEERAYVMLSGATFIEASSRDEDASQSRYGELTVAIDIWICETALNLLAHEFGHTQYIVPNLAAYRKYYHDTYSGALWKTSRAGHHPSDLSGMGAFAFGHQFLRDRKTFRQNSSKPVQRVTEVMRNIRKDVNASMASGFDESIASSTSYE